MNEEAIRFYCGVGEVIWNHHPGCPWSLCLRLACLHDLRHSAASLLILVLKMPPKLVQELLGHSTLDMTMDIYTHVDES